MAKTDDEKAAEKQEAADKKAAEKQLKEDKKLAETESPAIVRVHEQGDWAASNNPSPEEQAEEQERSDAITRVDQNG